MISEPFFLPWNVPKCTWSWTLELSPPRDELPYVTTVPSAKIAAKASPVPQISWTLCSWSWTKRSCHPQSVHGPMWQLCSPPRHHKANALLIAATFGCNAIAMRLSPSWSPVEVPETSLDLKGVLFRRSTTTVSHPLGSRRPQVWWKRQPLC